MSKKRLEKTSKILDIIVIDMEKFAKLFDSQPITEKTIAAYFGLHGAAIATLAELIKVTISRLYIPDIHIGE